MQEEIVKIEVDDTMASLIKVTPLHKSKLVGN
jgi:hypothetical protein